jgi:ferritin-like metal-binding protein YciE
MTKKEKRGEAHSEPAKDGADKDSTSKDNTVTEPSSISARELFDSSRYNAMSDMTKGSDLETISVETLSDTQRTTKSIRSEQIDNELLVSNTDAKASVELAGEEISKITPMMVKERARTLREVKEGEAQQQYASSSLTTSSSSMSHQSGNEKKFGLYLNILLSIENAAAERLQSRIPQSPLPEIREQLERHMEETIEQKSRLIKLIHRLGGQPTNEHAELHGYTLPKVLEDAFKASATTSEEQELRTMEVDAMIENAEVIGYNIAIQMATKINIGEAIVPLRQNLQEEEKMVAWMRANLPSNFVRLWSKIEDVQLPESSQQQA